MCLTRDFEGSISFIPLLAAVPVHFHQVQEEFQSAPATVFGHSFQVWIVLQDMPYDFAEHFNSQPYSIYGSVTSKSPEFLHSIAAFHHLANYMASLHYLHNLLLFSDLSL